MIIVFDGECVLCSGWVRFLLRFDRKRVFRFAAMQSPAGRAFLDHAGLRVDRLETLLLVDGDRDFRQTAAIFRILHGLGGVWRLAWIAWVIPAPIRDALYRWVARNRYRIFGRRETCYLPGAEDAWRFLDK